MTSPLEINNLVATFQLSSGALTDSNYVQIAYLATNAEWKPKRFHAIILRGLTKDSSRKRHSSALVYRSGKCVLTGAGQTLSDAHRLARRVCKMIDGALGRSGTRPQQLRIVNIVANARLPCKISAERAVKGRSKARVEHNNYAYAMDYDPTEFPALKCRMTSSQEEGTLSILAFNNGKLILTGLRNAAQVERYYLDFVEMLKREELTY
jgi:TATA-box binding protein (TBP) (component of TFIID and TFIIIB)